MALNLWSFITSISKGSPVSGAENKQNFDAITEQALRKDNNLGELTPTASAARAAISAASLGGNNFTDSQSVNADYATLVLNNSRLQADGYARLTFAENSIPRGGLYRTYADVLMYTRWDATGALVDNPFSVDANGVFKLNKALPVGSGGTGQIADGTAGQYLASQGAGQPMMWVNPVNQTTLRLKNRFVNGEMYRYDAALQARNVAEAYGPVNFRQSFSAGGFTISQDTMAYGGVTFNTTRMTCTAVPTLGSGDLYGLVSSIENSLCYDFVNSQFVCAVVFKASVAGTYAVSIRDNGTPVGTPSTIQSFISTFTYTTAGAAELVILKIPANPNLFIPNVIASRMIFTFGLVSGATFQTPPNVWTTGNYIATSGLTPWATATGNYIEITRAHVEKGPDFTGFELVPAWLNDLMCDRYSQLITASFNGVALGRGAGADVYRCSAPLRSKMRGTPQIFSNMSAGAFTGATGPNVNQWTIAQSGIAYVELATPTVFTIGMLGSDAVYLLSQHNTPSGLRTGDTVAIGTNLFILATSYL